jgi:hypothetical protein
MEYSGLYCEELFNLLTIKPPGIHQEIRFDFFVFLGVLVFKGFWAFNTKAPSIHQEKG